MKKLLFSCPGTSLTASTSLLLMRMAFGLSMIAAHGWGKMMKLFSDEPIQFVGVLGIPPPIGFFLVTVAETLCAVLVALGLFTRVSLVPLIITMAVAVFVVKLGKPFEEMELALLFLVGYVAIFLQGPGKFSLDHYLN